MPGLPLGSPCSIAGAAPGTVPQHLPEHPWVPSELLSAPPGLPPSHSIPTRLYLRKTRSSLRGPSNLSPLTFLLPQRPPAASGHADQQIPPSQHFIVPPGLHEPVSCPPTSPSAAETPSSVSPAPIRTQRTAPLSLLPLDLSPLILPRCLGDPQKWPLLFLQPPSHLLGGPPWANTPPLSCRERGEQSSPPAPPAVSHCLPHCPLLQCWRLGLASTPGVMRGWLSLGGFGGSIRSPSDSGDVGGLSTTPAVTVGWGVCPAPSERC